MNIYPILSCKTKEELYEWLLINHVKENFAFVQLGNKNDTSHISYLELVYEVIKFGWIDGLKIVHEDKSLIRISKRRLKNSNWTEQNKARARYLIDHNLMHESGYSVLPNIDIDLFQIDQFIIDRIKEDEETYENFLKLPKLYLVVKIDNIQAVRENQELYLNRLSKFIKATKNNQLYGLWNDNGILK